MIGYIRGTVIFAEDRELIVEAGNSGVGYRVWVAAGNVADISVGDEISLYIYTQVREDAIELYGFKTSDERTLFTKLVTVNGVGAKSALSILDTLSPAELQDAILNGDVATLKRVPGIGPKVAQRLILELEGVMRSFAFSDAFGTARRTQGSQPRTSHPDTRSALLNLGFAEQDISRALGELDVSGLSLDVSGEIRWVLRYLKG